MNLIYKYFTFITIYIGLLSTPNLLFAQANSGQTTIVLDPGHGGHDEGCNWHRENFEKEIVLGIALKLERFFKQNRPDLRILLTRRSDVFVPLHKRSDLANLSKADLFISLHCNYIPSSKRIRGSETFVNGIAGQETEDVASRENNAIYLETNIDEYENLLSDEYHIFQALNQNAYLEESLLLASVIESAFDGIPGYKSRGVKQARFVVLQRTEMPSVLIETGYITNAQDRSFLLSEAGQTDIAKAIFNAVNQYVNSRP